MTHRQPESQPHLIVAAHTDGTIRAAGLEITVAANRDLDVLVLELDSDPEVPEQVMLQDLFALASDTVSKTGRGVTFRNVVAGTSLVVFARGEPDSVSVASDRVQAVLRCTACSSDGAHTWSTTADTGVVTGRWQ